MKKPRLKRDWETMQEETARPHFYDSHRELIFRLEMQDGGSKPVQVFEFVVNEDVRDALRPLHRNHDVPFDAVAYNCAMEQQKKRNDYIKLIAGKFANVLYELIKKRDPVCGDYPHETEQYRAIVKELTTAKNTSLPPLPTEET